MTDKSTEARQDAMAGIREKIKVILRNIGTKSVNICPAVINDDAFADQILSLPVSSGGGECQSCRTTILGKGGKIYRYKGNPIPCLDCNGTGQARGITHTLLEWAELGMQLSLR